MIGQWTFQWLQQQGYQANYIPSTTSTNLIAKENAMAEKSPVVFYITDEQSMGRGQGNNKWINPAPGKSLLMTCSLLSTKPPQPELCLTFGRHLKSTCAILWDDLQWRIKPPNDLFLENKKVAGILLESVTQGAQYRLLFGLGFNVFEFPQTPEFEATCLKEHLETSLTEEKWTQFLGTLVSQFLGDNSLR